MNWALLERNPEDWGLDLEEETKVLLLKIIQKKMEVNYVETFRTVVL